MHEVEGIFEAECIKKEIIIEIIRNEDLKKIFADRDKIKEVVINLVKNGIEAVSDKKENKKIKIKIFENGIEIFDNGCGIKPENIGNIFNFYFTTKSGGNGVGLFRVKKIVEAHGGKIDVESKDRKSVV